MSTSNAYNRDCLQAMREYPDHYFDLAICDPPYFPGVDKLGYFGDKQSSIGVKRGNYNIPQWDKQIPDQKWLDEVVRVSKNQIIWGINYFTFHHCVGRIVWDKCNDGAPFSQCEIASCSMHDSVRIFRFLWNGMNQGEGLNNPTKMQGNKSLNETRIHPTQKPVALYSWLLKNYAKPGDKILDTHLGSGSSRIAAWKMGFDFTGYELDPDYFEAQEKRFKEMQGVVFDSKGQVVGVQERLF